METSDLSKHTQVLPDGTTLQICNYQPSITSVLRSVKRLEHSNLNNIASLVHDAAFISDISTALPSLPLFANARCGLWYTPHYHAISYFKSTDGHNNNWSFNLKRLNLHVAYQAAHSHGAIIVDATRRGKRFPDSMSKTIPIWAAVINMAISRIYNNTSNNNDGDCNCIHLPPWVSVNEKNQIAQRLDGWVSSLLGISREDLLPLVDILQKKPLQCFWVSQPCDDDNNADADGKEKGDSHNTATFLSSVEDSRETMFENCTPLILVSAALPNARMRRTLTLHNPSIDDNDDAHSDMKPAFPSVLKLVYEYIPGAGDDEESWAHGLTPSLMWKHHFQLLTVGAREGEEALKEMMCDIVARHHGGNKKNAHAHDDDKDSGLESSSSILESTVVSMCQQIGNTGLFLGTKAAASSPTVWSKMDAILNVGSTSPLPAALMWNSGGSGNSAKLPSCIQLFQTDNSSGGGGGKKRLSAVQPYHFTPPSSQHQHQQQQQHDDDDDNDIQGPAHPQALLQKPNSYYLWLPIRQGKKDRHDLQAKLPAALQFISYHLEAGRTVLLHDDVDDGTVGSDVAASIAVASIIACFNVGLNMTSLPTLAHTISSNNRDNNNHNNRGDNATATDTGISSLSLLSPPGTSAGPRTSRQFKSKPVKIHPTTGCPLPVIDDQTFDKLAVKKALAILAVYCPEVRPSQTSLKQVYNCFLS